MRCNLDFKFNIDDIVRVRQGGTTVEGRVTARVEERSARPIYRIQDGTGNEFQAAEWRMRIVSIVPKWLRVGAESRWMGEGKHDRYVVRELSRGGQYSPWTFAAELQLFRPDGTPCGCERVFTRCIPGDMEFWRPCQAGELEAGGGAVEEGRR